MDHDEQSGDSIGAILSSLATTLREVSNKLDAVAAHVDDDRNLSGRLAKLEAWAFRTGEDVSKIGNRLEQVATGPEDEAEPESRPEPVTPVVRERREAIPSRRDRLQAGGAGSEGRAAGGERLPAPGLGSEGVPPAGGVGNERLQAGSERRQAAGGAGLHAGGERLQTAGAGNEQLPTRGINNERLQTGSLNNERLQTGSLNNEQLPTSSLNNERLRTGSSERHHAGGQGNERLEPPANDPANLGSRGARTEFTAPATRTDHLEPFGPATPGDSTALPTRTPQPIPPAYRGEPVESAASTTRSEWLDPANSAEPAASGYNRLESPASPSSGSNGRLEPLTSPRNGYESAAPTTRPDSGMTAPRTNEPSAIPPGAHRATTGEDTSHVDKLQAMLDELKRNPHGPFGRPESPNELPGVDPNFAIRTDG